MMYKLSDFEGVINLSSTSPDAFDKIPERMLILGNIHVKIGDAKAGFRVFEKLVAIAPGARNP